MELNWRKWVFLAVAGIITGSAGWGCGGGGGSSSTTPPDNGGGDPGGGDPPPDPTPVYSGTVFYGIVPDTSIEIHAITSTGTGDHLIATLPADYRGFSIMANGSYVFGATNGASQFGIYKGSSVDAATATQVVPPSFDDIWSIQASPDGASIYFIGSVGSVSSLYVVSSSGGTPRYIDDAYTFALSPLGTQVAYTKQDSFGRNVYLSNVAVGSAPRALAASTSESDYIAWSPDSRKLIFNSNRNGSSFDLYMVGVDGIGFRRITLTNDADELGCAFSPDGLSIVTVEASLSTSNISVVRYTLTSGLVKDRLSLVSDSTLLGDASWSSATRSRSLRISSPLLLKRRHH